MAPYCGTTQEAAGQGNALEQQQRVVAVVLVVAVPPKLFVVWCRARVRPMLMSSAHLVSVVGGCGTLSLNSILRAQRSFVPVAMLVKALVQRGRRSVTVVRSLRRFLDSLATARGIAARKSTAAMSYHALTAVALMRTGPNVCAT